MVPKKNLQLQTDVTEVPLVVANVADKDGPDVGQVRGPITNTQNVNLIFDKTFSVKSGYKKRLSCESTDFKRRLLGTGQIKAM